MTGLSNRERRVLRYEGLPAKDVAVAEHMTVNEVLEIRHALRYRGAVVTEPEVASPGTQLTFAALDAMMRHNTSSAL